MTSGTRTGFLAGLAALAVSTGAAADGWSYEYKGISVTTEGSPAYAVKLAHNLYRLDSAVTALLGIQLPPWRPPMRIYSIGTTEATRLIGAQEAIGSSFAATDYGSDVLLTDARQENRYWGAYFGYAGSLLVGEGKVRYPIWYVRGFSHLFASAEVQIAEVTIGKVPEELVAPLLSSPLVPLRTLFNTREDDPSLRDSAVQERYDAESWLLVHLIAVEKHHAQDFAKYFALMSEGRTETEAFASSFSVSYEQLDKELYAALSDRRLYQLTLKVRDEPDATRPERLSVADLNARLVEFASRTGLENDYLLQLANQGVQAEPGNPRAREALAHLQAVRGKYAEALKLLEIAAPGSSSPLDLASQGDTLVLIADRIGEDEVAPGVKRAALIQRARDDYEKAVAQDGENLQYMASLAVAIGTQRDAAGAKKLLPQAAQLYSKHPRYAILPRALAFMCGNTGDLDGALKYAAAWRDDALTSQDREDANSYISRARTLLQRQEPLQKADAP
ncbi:MAG TPA: hypothetical protein VFO44_15455 [Steroidobacteraceae bacterium]|nr:hypothetical protein [Steroidobacteraceae bacterium]